MASITSLKAVRTRYRNTLNKELHAASDLLKSDTTDTDAVSMLNKSIDILRTYIDKLEIQSGKLSDAVFMLQVFNGRSRFTRLHKEISVRTL